MNMKQINLICIIVGICLIIAAIVFSFVLQNALVGGILVIIGAGALLFGITRKADKKD